MLTLDMLVDLPTNGLDMLKDSMKKRC